VAVGVEGHKGSRGGAGRVLVFRTMHIGVGPLQARVGHSVDMVSQSRSLLEGSEVDYLVHNPVLESFSYNNHRRWSRW
jgi:hypothetical protein